MKKSKILTIDNLMVIDIHADNLSEILKKWRTKDGVLCAESCARQVFYGFEEDLAGFPFEKLTTANQRIGAEAYEFLLMLTSGCESLRYGETHIKSQFFDRWKKDSQKSFFPTQRYEKFIGGLRRDVNHVQNTMMPGYKKLEPEQIARDLSRQKKGDNIVVLGDLSLRGLLSARTERIIRICENRQKKRDDFLTLTHPSNDTLDALRGEVDRMKKDGKFRSNIFVDEFKRVAGALVQADQVYATIQMGTVPDGEQEIVDLWHGKEKTGQGTLTHIAGIPGVKATSSELWKGANLRDYFSPEDVEEEKRRRHSNNEDVDILIRKAFKAIANIRGQGKPVIETDLNAAILAL